MDIGLSVAASSAAQSGDIKTGDFTVGGSGGVNQTPPWLWIVLVAGGAVLFLGYLALGPRR